MALPLIDEHGAAEYLGITVSWLRTHRYLGDGPKFVKLGSKVLYQPEELDRYVEAHLRQRSDRFADQKQEG